MTEQEAYERLAKKMRAVLSRRKLELYRELKAIEDKDELTGHALIRACEWEGRGLAMQVGDCLVWPTGNSPTPSSSPVTAARVVGTSMIRLLETEEGP